MASEPTGLKASKGLELLTGGTPNGFKITILLEELKDAYGLDYTWQAINIMQNTQKQAWFTALGPNGRIPVLHDHDRNISVMEGAAILSYLTRHFDPEHKFSFVEEPHLTDQEQWIAWQHGGLGPMQGQANHFYRMAKERIPYATQRYVGESERLYGVLNERLEGRDYVAGPGRGKFSIADMASYGWVSSAKFAGLDMELFPNVARWFDKIYERPGVQRGMAIPKESTYGLKRYDETLRNDPEARKKEDNLKEHLKKAQEQYGYKYQTP